MVGEKLETRYFGTYTECKDVSDLPQEFEGDVIVRSLNGCRAAFLCQGKRRYDLPLFMAKYRNRQVVVLGRPYVKRVADKTYHKLVVISVKSLN